MLVEGKRLFGTDGVRGVANTELTPEFTTDLGRAAGSLLSDGPVLIGRDTRRSGEMLSLALQAGFHSAGIDTTDVGIITSGAISHLTAATSATLGAVVSASHNPAEDNGIKLLAGDGTKLSDQQEDEVEARMRAGAARKLAVGPTVGTRYPVPDAMDRYLQHLTASIGYSLHGLELAVDCANGAAYQAAPLLFERLGATAEIFNNLPDGLNINAGCGATTPEFISAHARGRIGLSFDGDADRLIAVDETGKVVNGDGVMAVIARHWKRNGRLPGDKLVTTVMSNLGFHKAMTEMGIEVIETKVGDRYVLEAMLANGAKLGGEQSGHVIFLDRARTGDGLLTALRLLEVVAGTGRTLASLASEAMTTFPQVLRNVPVPNPISVNDAVAVWSAVETASSELGDSGRILVRPSGTEPYVRVMVEAASQEIAGSYAERLAAVVAAEIGRR